MTEHDPLDLVPSLAALPPAEAAALLAEARGLIGKPPATVAASFRRIMALTIPAHDGTIAGQRATAEAVRRHALSENTVKAYRAGVKAWCAYAARHGVQALPADPDDIAAFLVAERQPLDPLPGERETPPKAMTTLRLRAAAIAYMHRLAGLPSPSQEAAVLQTIAGFQRLSAELPKRKLPLRVAKLRQVIAEIPAEGLANLRDRAVLLVGFAGALRRSELAALELRGVEIIDTPQRQGLRIVLPRSKGDRRGTGTTIVIPAGATELCPLAAFRAWVAAAAITEGLVFRRIHLQPRPKRAPAGWVPRETVGSGGVNAEALSQMIKRRGAATGLDAKDLGGHLIGSSSTRPDLSMRALGRQYSTFY